MNKLTSKIIAHFFKKTKRKHIRQILYQFSISDIILSIYYVFKILLYCPKQGYFIIEANPFHTECLYSILFYLKNKKNIIILGDKKALSLGILDQCSDFSKPKYFFITPISLWFLDQMHFFNHSRFMFANSYLVWLTQSSIEYLLPEYLKTKKSLFTIDHAPGKWTNTISKRTNVHQLVLADFLSNIYGFPAIYTCIFPQQIQKSKQFLFLSIGAACDSKRRDMNSFISWMEEHRNYQSCIITKDLSDKNIYNRIKQLPNNTLLFSPSFTEMFNSISQSIFMPFLIHGDNLGYYQTSISGNMNLALGFGIIPIIDTRLAQLYGFTDKEAIIYNGQSKFFDALNQASLLSEQEINKIQKALLSLRNKHIQKSISFFNTFIKS